MNRHCQQWRMCPCVLAARGCSLPVGAVGNAPTLLWDPQSLGAPVHSTHSCPTWDSQSSIRLKQALPHHLSLLVSDNFMKDTSQPSRAPSLTSPWGCLLSVSLLTFYATLIWTGKWGLCLSGFNPIMPFYSFLLSPQFQTSQLNWQDLASMDSIWPSRLMTWVILEA